MKKYSEYMDEITPTDLYKGLVAHGLFADRLPPIFTSEGFYEFCEKNKPVFKSKAYGYVYYESIRNTNIPRQLGIPVPMAHELLAKSLTDNWDKIQTYFREKTERQIYKVSRIHVRKMKESKELFEMNYSNWRNDGTVAPDLLIGQKYIVSADISKFFPSIYTHSLTWALTGKQTAKKKRRGEWFNDIDEAVQKTKDCETHGIIIGPHTSNILSEIILTAIDKKLINSGWKYVRAIDDYTCYVESEEKGEQFISELQKELRVFDLSLNHKKTSIHRLPEAAVEQWIRKINSITLLTNYGKMDYKYCRAYLDYAIEIFKHEGYNSAVLKYALKVMNGIEMTDNAKKYEQQTVFHLCILYPYLVPLLDKYIFQHCSTSIEEIKHIANLIYCNSIDNLAYEAVSYAIYFAIKYKFSIEKADVKQLITCEDCIVLILAYKYFLSQNDNEA